MNYDAERVFSNDIVRLATIVGGPVSTAKELRELVDDFCKKIQEGYEAKKRTDKGYELEAAMAYAIHEMLKKKGKGMVSFNQSIKKKEREYRQCLTKRILS